MLVKDKDTDLTANNPPVTQKEKKSRHQASADIAPDSAYHYIQVCKVDHYR